MIGIIAATSLNGVIGTSENKIPFHYPDDLRYFKEMTMDSVVIMGSRTFESIGKPLPNRENIIITSQDITRQGVKTYTSIPKALSKEFIKLRDHSVNTWFIGGASIYQEAMLYADEIHLTITPDYIAEDNTVKFPWINPLMFELCGYTQLSDPPSEKLICVIYKRKTQNNYYEKIISDTKIDRDK
jgi:dihydrofolate reductase